VALVHALIPSGFSVETKKKFIEGTKKAMCDSFDFTPVGVSVWLSEFDREDMCEHAAKKRVLIVYSTAGKTSEQKNTAAGLFEKVCADVLGPDKGDTFIVFKEHTTDNLSVRGILKSLDPAPISFHKD